MNANSAPNGTYAFDYGMQGGVQMPVNQPPMGQGFPYTNHGQIDVNGDLYGGVPIGNNPNMMGGASTIFGNTPAYNGYPGQPQGNFMPFGMPQGTQMGPTPVHSYQTGSGNTFFHQGCNVQYTDVKTFTTTIHLHCSGSADESSHPQNSKNTNVPHQTMHITSMMPSQQLIQHQNMANGAA